MTTPFRAPDATAFSAALREERSAIAAGLQKGLSLAVLLDEQTDCLQGVTIYRLVKMLPGVGAARQRTLMQDLPHYEPLRCLTAQQRAILTSRIATYERHRFKLSGVVADPYRTGA